MNNNAPVLFIECMYLISITLTVQLISCNVCSLYSIIQGFFALKGVAIVLTTKRVGYVEALDMILLSIFLNNYFQQKFFFDKNINLAYMYHI